MSKLKQRSLPLLSICIPTYNRYRFLKMQLNMLVRQINENNLEKYIEIIISDNASSDETKHYVGKKMTTVRFIRYFSNDRNVGLVMNIIKAITYSKGSYTWLLSDDDIVTEDSLQNMITLILKFQPNIIINNFKKGTSASGLIEKYTAGKDLGINDDLFLKTKANFFQYLSTSNFFTLRNNILAWMSISIVKTSILKKNLNKFTKNTELFKGNFGYPHTYLIYTNLPKKNYLISAKKAITLTLGNSSWSTGIKSANDVVISYFNPILKCIYDSNKDMPLVLKCKLAMHICYSYAVQLYCKLL